MRFAATIAVLLAIGAIFIATSSTVHAQAETNTQNETKVEVESGDTLSGIAHEHDTVYQRLFNANEEIKDPNLIYPGQTLRIPDANEELTERVSAPAPAPQPEPVATPEPVAQQPAEPTPAPAPAPEPANQNATVDGGVWDRLAQCESTGNWSINTGNGFYGGLQFTLQSWRAVGGTGYPHQASKAEQINRAERLLAIQGWGAWPACSEKLGLR